jgi:hypothetical protein
VALCTVTGNIRDILGDNVTTGTVHFLLTNLGIGNVPTVAGTSIIVPLTTDVAVAADGSFSVQLQGNDTISPANTVYAVTYYAPGGQIGPILYAIVGATFNLNSAVPAAAMPPVAVFPQQAANEVFAGPPSGPPETPDFRALVLADLPALSSFNLTDSTNLGRLNASNIWTGDEAHTGAEKFKRLETTVYADQFPGATADVQIAAAIAYLGVNGGIVDCTGYGNSVQTLQAAVTVPNNVFLRASHAVTFQPGTTSNNMFVMMAGSSAEGVYCNTTNQFDWTGVCFLFNDQYTDQGHTTLKKIKIVMQLLVTTLTNGYGTGIQISSTSTSQSEAFIIVDDVHIYGGEYGVLLTSTGTGLTNGNLFSNIHSESQYGFALITTAGGAVSGNMFTNCSYQYQGANTCGFYLSGNVSGYVIANTFSNFVIWDTPSPNIILNTYTENNTFFGWNGTASPLGISDSGTSNVFFSPYYTYLGGALEINGATPTGSGTKLGLGTTTGFGNGSSGTPVTTTTKSTGTGPATPQTVVKYLEIDLGGTKYWIGLVQ